MGAMVLMWTLCDMNNIIILILQIITGVVIYVGGSKLFKLESYTYIVSMVKQRKN